MPRRASRPLSLRWRPARQAAVALAGAAVCAVQLRAQTPAAVPAVPSDGSATTTVIVVRHAERATEPAADPVLSPAGEARAAALADALTHARVTGIVSTPYQRTRLTAAPLARSSGITPVVVATRGGAPHARIVADTVRALFHGGTVLVVGHSNTVPAIIAALGGPTLPDLCETEYATMFVLVLRPGAEPSLTRARYGPEDPAPGASCVR